MARRPPKSSYSPATAEAILDAISDGSSFRAACEKFHVPRSMARGWLVERPEFKAACEAARFMQLDVHADELIELADAVRGSVSNAEVQAARLAVDTRKWILAKLHPRYADALQVTGKGGEPLLPAAEPEPGKVALAILTMLEAARRDAEPPVVEHEAEPVIVHHLEPEPGPAALEHRPGNRTLLNLRQAEELHQREVAVERENVRLRVVQFPGSVR